MEEQKEELIHSLLIKILEDLKNMSKNENISGKDLENFVKTYEKKLKAIEKKNKPKPSLFLKFGESYILDEEKPFEIYSIFKQALSMKNAGLCITRTNPESISMFREMQNVKFIWLSRANVSVRDEYSILQPTDLANIVNNVSEFVKNNAKAVILFEGIELLSASNGFQNLAKALTTIKDYISANKAILIMSANLKALKEDEKNFLLREFNQILLS